MEQLSVGSSSHLIDDGGFQIEEHTSRNVFSGTSFRKESVESIVSSSNGFIRWHLSIWLNSVFKTEKFPAGVTELDTALSDMDVDDFSHC
jgi:hypothetical protein